MKEIKENQITILSTKILKKNLFKKKFATFISQTRIAKLSQRKIKGRF
jgi:hypothetical protein